MLIGYARVSHRDQNPQLQLNALRKAGCERIFAEKISSTKAERPQLQSMLSFAREGDTIVVWKFDRLARSLKDLIDITETLKRKRIGFKSLTESVDTSTPTGKLLFHLLATLAEFERSLIRERMSAGMAAAREAGRFGGRPSVLTPAQVAHARELRKIMSHRQAAETLGVGESTLYRYLANTPNQGEPE